MRFSMHSLERLVCAFVCFDQDFALVIHYGLSGSQT